MRNIHADLYRSHDQEGCKGCLLQKVYLATEVDAHVAALRKEHVEFVAALQTLHEDAMAEKDKRIASLEEKQAVIYDSLAVYSELASIDGTVSADKLSLVLDAITRIWKRLP